MVQGNEYGVSTWDKLCKDQTVLTHSDEVEDDRPPLRRPLLRVVP